METLQVHKQFTDYNSFKNAHASESDFSRLISKSTIVKEGSQTMIIYLDLDEFNFNSSQILDTVAKIKFETDSRTSGLASNSRIFGFAPRIKFRNDYCTLTNLSRDQPSEAKIIHEYAKRISEMYKLFNPKLYEKHQHVTEKVKLKWKIEGGLFTSGIINRDNYLKYHFDTGNFKNVWSCMLGFKKGIKGGHLACPEYNIGFEIKNNSLFMFEGQNILHGVTPFEKENDDSFRITIVYYSLKEMWKCLEINDEIARARTSRMFSELKRAYYDKVKKTIRTFEGTIAERMEELAINSREYHYDIEKVWYLFQQHVERHFTNMARFDLNEEPCKECKFLYTIVQLKVDEHHNRKMLLGNSK